MVQNGEDARFFAILLGNFVTQPMEPMQPTQSIEPTEPKEAIETINGDGATLRGDCAVMARAFYTAQTLW